ncbi:MAG TPA: transporter [Puia sp.]|nr:transporter [Puia sp.]
MKKSDRATGSSMLPLLRNLIFFLFLQLGLSHSAQGQLRGTHMLGDAGLQGGSQPPPSLTLMAPLYNYHTSTFVKSDGGKIDAPDINMFVLGLGASVVTNAKILGGNYGASLLFSLASSKIEGNLVSSKSSLAFSDTYIQPLQLGWETKQADFSFGYALYLPTGKYELGGSSNAGMGMFTNELSAGTTVYFDAKKQWNFSALFSYAINSAKKNTGDNKITVGNLLSWEGGMGKTWYVPVRGSQLPMIINGGLVYYLEFKTTRDQMQIPALDGSPIDLANKDHIYALGAEADIFIPTINSNFGLRWLDEFGARNRTRGNTFFVTLAPYVKFFAPKKKK